MPQPPFWKPVRKESWDSLWPTGERPPVVLFHRQKHDSKGEVVAKALSFSFRDVPACARYGFSARKIWIFLKTIVLSWLVWDFFVYLGFFASGCDMAARWSQSRMLPLPGSIFWMNAVPVVFLAVAILMILYLMMRGGMMAARLTFQQIRGDEFYSTSDASDFASRHGKPLIAVPLMILSALVLILAAVFITGLVSRIPAAGPVIGALLSIPMWGLMLLGVLVAIALLLALDLVPVVVACTGGDSFEAIFEVFSTITSQSWRLLLYMIIAIASIAAAGVLFLLATSFALSSMGIVFGHGAGDMGLNSAMASGPQTLAPEALPFFSGLISLGHQDAGQAWSGVPGLLAAVSGTLIFFIVLSYFLSAWVSAWTIIYVVLRYRKDGEDLPRRADMEDLRAFDRMYGESGSPSDDK
jgi:hypothetical protein